jgi:hypothetical protein
MEYLQSSPEMGLQVLMPYSVLSSEEPLGQVCPAVVVVAEVTILEVEAWFPSLPKQGRVVFPNTIKRDNCRKTVTEVVIDLEDNIVEAQ